MGSRRRQSGSIMVLVALALPVLLAMIALVLDAGYDWTTRRHLQELADASALSGGHYIGLKACGNATSPLTQADALLAFQKAEAVLDAQLGTASGGITGGCPAWHYNLTYPNNISVTMNFPYGGVDANEIEVIAVQTNQLFLSGFIGLNQAIVKGRAVVRHDLGLPTGSYALFARQLLECDGSNTVTVQGSIYFGGSFTQNGQCGYRAEAVGSYPNYLDFGDIIGTDNTVSLSHSSTACASPLCADGLIWIGSQLPLVCGTPGVNEYLADSRQQSVNPNPCSSGVQAPVVQTPTYPDPNSWLLGQGQGCAVNGRYPAATPYFSDASGFQHFHPGCYRAINFAPGNYFLDPGFYYFNGAGLTLPGGAVLLGTDVTLEFAKTASFTALNCGSTCAFGADPARPSPDPGQLATGKTYFSAPPTDGSSSWCKAGCPAQGMLTYNGDASSTGQWTVKGPHSFAYLEGTNYWPYGDCTWYANGAGNIQGQLVCNNIYMQGGSISIYGDVAYGAGAVAPLTSESLLVE